MFPWCSKQCRTQGTRSSMAVQSRVLAEQCNGIATVGSHRTPSDGHIEHAVDRRSEKSTVRFQSGASLDTHTAQCELNCIVIDWRSPVWHCVY